MVRKIAILIDSLKSGGAQKQSALLAKALSSKYEVLFVIFDGRDSRKSFLDIITDNPKIRIVSFHSNKIFLLSKIYTLLRKERPDVSFSYLPFANIVNGLLATLAGVKYRVGGIRNSYLERLKFVFQRPIHNYFLTASISNSRAGQLSHFKGGQDKRPIFHIPNCFPSINEEVIRPIPSTITILSVGRFVEQKNYSLAISSFKECKEWCVENFPSRKIKYTIVGYGSLKEQIYRIISEMDLLDDIEIVEDPSDINYYYRTSDIYLCTSLFEGLSNSIMEAMSFSLPIVATDVGGNAELVKDDYNGYLTDLTTKNVVDKLIKLIGDDEVRNRFGSNSYRRLIDNFSEDAFFRRYDDLINRSFKEI